MHCLISLPYRSDPAEDTGDTDMTLTNRSKIIVRYTTNPADMGYDGTPSNWETEAGEVMGIRRAVCFPQELNSRIGQGVFRRVSYTCNGTVVSHDDIQMHVACMGYKP
jgi:hypothetical protein